MTDAELAREMIVSSMHGGNELAEQRELINKISDALTRTRQEAEAQTAARVWERAAQVAEGFEDVTPSESCSKDDNNDLVREIATTLRRHGKEAP